MDIGHSTLLIVAPIPIPPALLADFAFVSVGAAYLSLLAALGIQIYRQW
jgi:hypothetical protein